MKTAILILVSLVVCTSCKKMLPNKFEFKTDLPEAAEKIDPAGIKKLMNENDALHNRVSTLEAANKRLQELAATSNPRLAHPEWEYRVFTANDRQKLDGYLTAAHVRPDGVKVAWLPGEPGKPSLIHVWVRQGDNSPYRYETAFISGGGSTNQMKEFLERSDYIVLGFTLRAPNLWSATPAIRIRS